MFTIQVIGANKTRLERILRISQICIAVAGLNKSASEYYYGLVSLPTRTHPIAHWHVRILLSTSSTRAIISEYMWDICSSDDVFGNSIVRCNLCTMVYILELIVSDN